MDMNNTYLTSREDGEKTFLIGDDEIEVVVSKETASKIKR